MSEKQKLPRKECLRCGHKWVRRMDIDPIVCPSCHSPYYSRPRTLNYKKEKQEEPENEKN